MKKTLTKSVCRISMLYFLITIVINSFIVNAQQFTLSSTSDLVRIFEDGYNFPLLSDTVKIFGIHNEIISGQCVIHAKINLTNVTVEVDQLKHQLTGESFPAGLIEWNFTGTIPLTDNAPNQSLSVITRKAPAKFPDYLMTERQLNITKGIYQSVWLTIPIPKNIADGLYEGKITVKTSQGNKSLPINLNVYPLNMPEERNLKITEWYSTGNFKRFHRIQEDYSEDWFSMLKKYAENMVAHRQNVFQVPMNSIQIKKLKNNTLEFDFTRFDQIAQIFWDTGKMDYLETGELARFKENTFSYQR